MDKKADKANGVTAIAYFVSGCEILRRHMQSQYPLVRRALAEVCTVPVLLVSSVTNW